MPTTPPSPAGIEIWYTTDGDPSAEPLLMIMGLGTQHVGWDEELVALLVERGYYVIRPDNRDVGLSSKPDMGGIDVLGSIISALGGQPVEAPYLLTDMADDAVAVLDALGLESAHVVGASMGGMIGQTMALEHPERVRSLTSIMSTPGLADADPVAPEVLTVLLGAMPTNREEAVARGLAIGHAIGSPGLVDEARVADKAGRSWDRCGYPQGVTHQLLAIAASGSRAERLTTLDVPTLVIHGEVDPLITVKGGRATAAAVPGAELRIIEGMGHDVPRVHWESIIDDIHALTTRVGAPVAG